MDMNNSAPHDLKILHVPCGYFPDKMGGTEVYVAALAKELKALHVTSTIIAPGLASDYAYEGIEVKRIPVSDSLSLNDIYSEGDPVAALKFGRALDVIKPEIVHFHALTAGASVSAMKEARRRRIPILLTYHTPTITCLRGLLRWGTTPCDGEMIVTRCAACALNDKGLPIWLSWLLARVPLAFSHAALQIQGGKLSTALGMRSLTSTRHLAARTALGLCERVVAPCDWALKVLVRNGVPLPKVLLCRQGLSRPSQQPVTTPPKASALGAIGTLRLVFVGRIHPTKGLHIVLSALALKPNLAVTLTIYGARTAGDAYANFIDGLAVSDSRVIVKPPLPNDQVVAMLAAHDLLVVPALWLETGPLVVYEAFAAGVPVLGSNLGGVSELVTDGVNGRLIAPGEPRIWAASLAEIAEDPSIRAEWQRNLPPVRTMSEVAVNMVDTYGDVLTQFRDGLSMPEVVR